MEKVYFFCDLINVLIWYIGMNFILKHRFKVIHSVLIEVLLSTVFAIVFTLPNGRSLIARMGTIISLALSCVLLFKEPWTKVILYLFGLTISSAFSEAICLVTYFPIELVYRMPGVPITNANILCYVAYFGSNIFLESMYCLALNKNRLKLEWREYLLFSFFPLSQMFLYLGIVYIYTKLQLEIVMSYFVGTLLLCYISDVGLIFAMRYISQRHQLITENEKMAALINNQEQHYNELIENYNEMRRMRHDMDNQLNVMKQLVKDGKSDEASEYINSLIVSHGEAQTQLCENSVLDSFLKSKIEQAAKLNIKINAFLKLGYYRGISNVNLVRAFGNILDNAIEAAAGIEDAEIQLKSYVSRGYLVIECSNPYDVNNSIKPKRDELLQRGIGNTVLAELASGHGGEFTHEADGETYKLKLIMYTEEKQNVEACAVR